MDCEAGLAAVRTAPTLLEGMRRAEDLAAVAGSEPAAVPLLVGAVEDEGDQLTAIAAVHALARAPHPAAVDALVALLDGGPPHLAEHAAWALAAAQPRGDALAGLVGLTAAGGFAGMLAQRTLETWAAATPPPVRRALVTALGATTDASASARLVETLGLVGGSATTATLRRLAADEDEASAARAAAVAALGDGPAAASSARDLLAELAAGAGPLAPVARLALHDLGRAPREVRARHGLAVAQLFLHADIDGQLRHSGQGDTGGIATLLVHLGDALLDDGSPIESVITISRGAADAAHFPAQLPLDVPRDEGAAPGPETSASAAAGPAARQASLLEEAGHHYASVPFWGRSVRASAAWPLRVAARRGIRRILEAAGPVDVLHLRMADVGSMAAAEVAADLGVPVVLTMAPDPQALIAARDADGTLTRAGFGEADVVEHLWFRDRLLRAIASRADHLVLFPRPDVERDLRELCGLDLSAEAERVSVLSEGIDVVALERAERQVREPDQRGEGVAAALAELDELLESLPSARRGLPLAVSVGRLHPVKGMATLVRAWADHAALRERCNLLVIGGDLDDPNDDEAAELERIEDVVRGADAPACGLLLAGHRPNSTTDAWLAAVRHGRPGVAAPKGVYVSASLKEEFGIAILEAMATGLVVVAPASGGPATYVTPDETGVLVDTARPPELAAAVARALDLAAASAAERHAEAAQRMVRERFGIATMAAALTDVYERVAARRHTPGARARVDLDGAP